MIQILSFIIAALAALTTKIDRLTVKVHKAKHTAIKADLTSKVEIARSVLYLYEDRQKAARIQLNTATIDVHKADIEVGKAQADLLEFLGE